MKRIARTVEGMESVGFTPPPPAPPVKVRGVAWMMGGPTGAGRSQLVYAVVGKRLLIRRKTGWRWGSYMDARTAESAAMSMTETDERAGLQLVAGPVEFSVASDDDDTVRATVAALFNMV